MKIIFAGTPEFAVPTLKTLIQSSHEIVAVYTQPDRPAGRGRQLTASPIKEIALQANLPIYQPISLRSKNIAEEFQTYAADVMVVVAYGLLLPANLLNITKHGCINIHPSLLPRWRGPTPIQSAILAGDETTGVTIMQMDEGMDTGPILKQQSIKILAHETSGQLHNRLAQQSTELLLKTLEELTKSKVSAIKQNNEHATYSHKITKKMAVIDWQQPAAVIERQVRAYHPWPIAQTIWQNQTCRIWEAELLTEISDQTPGTIIHFDKKGIDVATGKQVLRINKLQLPGHKLQTAMDFINAQQTQLKNQPIFGNQL